MKLGTVTKEEPIPLLDHNKKRVDKPEVNTVTSQHGALASLKGRIDVDSSPAVRDRLIAFLHTPHPTTVSIDLSGITHIDSSGIATLIEALKIARNSKTEIRLQGLHDRLHCLFEATGILPLFSRFLRIPPLGGRFACFCDQRSHRPSAHRRSVLHGLHGLYVRRPPE
jgi:anti-anti-sigma factor